MQCTICVHDLKDLALMLMIMLIIVTVTVNASCSDLWHALQFVGGAETEALAGKCPTQAPTQHDLFG